MRQHVKHRLGNVRVQELEAFCEGNVIGCRVCGMMNIGTNGATHSQNEGKCAGGNNNARPQHAQKGHDGKEKSRNFVHGNADDCSCVESREDGEDGENVRDAALHGRIHFNCWNSARLRERWEGLGKAAGSGWLGQVVVNY